MTNPFALDTPVTTPTTASAPAPSVTTDLRPPTAPVAPPSDVDPFSGPAPQLPRGPRLRDIYGRLILLVPHKLELQIPSTIEPGTFQDRMTADVIVLDGGPIAYGGKPEDVPPIPHDKTAQVPHRTKRQFISAVGLISQCREALEKRARHEPGMVLGRLMTSGNAPKPGQNAPWLLSPPNDADKAVARAYLATVDPFA